eukprot:TRINITY_DN16160_c0_g1_i1.p1 TRINITY_DN16160_c0_g1~~TRINITY_DN16160_c0_g1_i1.p1  ORF type:complete len:306 (-),score=26.20 TRINITY_DN16160_c0_g1_i1:48-965(-)
MAKASLEIMCCDGYLEVNTIEQQDKSARDTCIFPMREKHIDVCQEGIAANDKVAQFQSQREQNDLHILRNGSLQHQPGCYSYGTDQSSSCDKPATQKHLFDASHSTLTCDEQETSAEPLSELISQHSDLPCPVSVGSRGHPEMCKRPCSFLLRVGYCRLGLNCTFCHLGHTNKHAHHLSKTHRELVRSLPCSAILTTAIPIAHEHMDRIIAKAKDVPMAYQALSVLQQELSDVLMASLAKVTSANPSEGTTKNLKTLRKDLSKVSLSFLISTVIPSLSAEDGAGAVALQEVEHRIRSTVEQYGVR